jgi:hypothetical protein
VEGGTLSFTPAPVSLVRMRAHAPGSTSLPRASRLCWRFEAFVHVQDWGCMSTMLRHVLLPRPRCILCTGSHHSHSVTSLSLCHITLTLSHHSHSVGEVLRSSMGVSGQTSCLPLISLLIRLICLLTALDKALTPPASVHFLGLLLRLLHPHCINHLRMSLSAALP